MPNDRPNILLLMTDQHRADCLGVEGHPVLQTPYLDELATEGIRFRCGYSESPVCIPSRRSLMTGQRPASHGVTMNYNAPLNGPTMPGLLSQAGYQTHLIGKLHLWPQRKLHGFDSSDWADSASPSDPESDYDRFLRESGINIPRAGIAHGADENGFTARPFHLDERYHFSNWVADSAIRFLERRDPTTPFFLKASFHGPHQPLTPPQPYYDRYMNMDLPPPPVADWARVFDETTRGTPVYNTWRCSLDPAVQKQMQAGYYGLINHIDDQIGRILRCLRRSNTIIIFTADHGEMLGEHQWIRKRSAYEGSAHIPYLMHFPKWAGIDQGRVMDQPVQLMDIMPTALDLAGVDIPDSVDGQSLTPLLRGESSAWREYCHGECAEVPTLDSGMHYLTDGKKKYIWYSGTGDEQLFDLKKDPNEMDNLAKDAACAPELETWRARLVERLSGRPEGFTDGRELTPIGGPSPFCLPGYERPEA
jgi:arylsulfatase